MSQGQQSHRSSQLSHQQGQSQSTHARTHTRAANTLSMSGVETLVRPCLQASPPPVPFLCPAFQPSSNTHTCTHIHHQMPNMAGRTGADPDAARLADYRAHVGVSCCFWLVLLLLLLRVVCCWGQAPRDPGCGVFCVVVCPPFFSAAVLSRTPTATHLTPNTQNPNDRRTARP